MDEFNDMVEKLTTFLDNCAAVGDAKTPAMIGYAFYALSEGCRLRGAAITYRMSGNVDESMNCEQLSDGYLKAAHDMIMGER